MPNPWILAGVLALCGGRAWAGTCSDLSGLPFVTVDLSEGVGSFGDDAVGESWTVTCPADITPCPVVSAPSFYTPLSGGVYSVLYQKTDGVGGMDQCTYDLFAGPTGLQIELSWNWSSLPPGDSVDLDLHVHEPGSIAPWGGNQGAGSDCAYDNCTVSAYSLGTGIDWFDPANQPPDPVNWYLAPVFEENACYFAPRGIGADWQSLGQGCHSPRLDIDNVACDPSEADPNDFAYCNPEIANIDFPPTNGWTRIGVHFFSANTLASAVEPTVRVTCPGRPPLIIGATGFDAPVSFPVGQAGTLFWLAADVLFVRDQDGNAYCVLRALEDSNAIGSSPILSDVTAVQLAFGPGYLPVENLFSGDFESPGDRRPVRNEETP